MPTRPQKVGEEMPPLFNENHHQNSVVVENVGDEIVTESEVIESHFLIRQFKNFWMNDWTNWNMKDRKISRILKSMSWKTSYYEILQNFWFWTDVEGTLRSLDAVDAVIVLIRTFS